MSSADQLTGVPNRATVQAYLDAELAVQRARRAFRGVALVIDVDGAACLNHLLGIEGVDALLQRLAGLLTAQGAGLFVGRLGGDEFFAFAHDEHLAEAAAQTTQQTMEDFARSRGFLDSGRLWQDHDFEYTLPLGTVTIGLARVSPTRCTASDVLRDADEAMYAGKRAGRNRLHWADA